MASRQGFGPSRRDLGMVSAAEIAATGRREEVQRLRTIVGPPPVKAGQGRTATKKAKAGFGQAGPGRRPGKHVPQVGKTAKKAASKAAAKPRAGGPVRIDRSRILPRLSAGEKTAALAVLARMFPHRTFDGLQELLTLIRREARHDVGAEHFLAEITGKTSPVKASGPVMSFARQRPLWGVRVDRFVRYGGGGR